MANTPFAPRTRVRLLKTLIWLLQLALVVYIGSALFADFGDPISQLQHQSGQMALASLLTTLCFTPYAKLSRQGYWLQARRLMGLWSFAWVVLHLLVFSYLDLALDWPLLFSEMLKRWYLNLGALAALLLLLLTLTSTHKMQRRLGRRWQQLHYGIYPALILATWHGLLAEKSSSLLMWGLSVIALVLLLWRVWAKFSKTYAANRAGK